MGANDRNSRAYAPKSCAYTALRPKRQCAMQDFNPSAHKMMHNKLEDLSWGPASSLGN